ncbi:Bud-site selection protein [Cristinia sonorae]|uniref:Bud-site selection protein n=1 Tax=Cristinia sonorae TaxID=1940300 RepID=A0A8K0XST9_9AGAR|nr:Bud-site selection protein [Cristinia sonorae]
MPSDQKTAGVKRKRGHSESAPAIDTKLEHKLHHGVVEVRRAAKKVKGLEMQKSVKRLKNVRAKDGQSSEIPQLEAELTYLKTLDVEKLGIRALHSKLKKDKVLSSNESFFAVLASELGGILTAPTTFGSPEMKVDARLLSSKALASEVSAVVTSLKNIINPPPKVPEDVKEEASDEKPPLSRKASKAKLPSTVEANSDSHSDGGEGSDEGIDVSEDEEELVDDDGWESGSIGGEEDQSVDDDSDAASDNDVPPPKKSKAAPANTPAKIATNKAAAKASGASTSTFLPSLSVGFTRGDSDSEPEEIDEAPKKNRRGQRARQAIWEKKYGRNANHVKKGQEEGYGNRGGHHSGTASTDRRQQRGRGRGSAPPQMGHRAPPSRPQDGGWNSAPARPQVDDKKDKPIHPSWEAKRRLKEKQNAGIVPPQGKKIVF